MKFRVIPRRRHAIRADGPGPAEVASPDETPYPESLERRAHPRPPLHFRRIELKYFLPDRFLTHFVERISPYTEVDPYLVREGLGRVSYPVTSLYFDSYDLQAFHEKEDGLFYRRKIRLRAYEDEFAEASPAFLEIKRRLDSVVIKDRLSLPAGSLRADVPVTRLLPHLLAQVDEADRTSIEAELMTGWLNLQSTAIVRYRRYAWVARENPSTRVTIDRDLCGTWRPPTAIGPRLLRSIDTVNATGTNGISGKYALLELKCDHTIPHWFHQIVQELELMRTAYSKYYLVVLALRPELLEDCDERFVGMAA